MEEKQSVTLTRRQEAKKFFLFVGFSISAGAVQVAVDTALHELTRLNYWACYLPALIASVLWNFTVNRKFTFKSVSNVPVAMGKVGIYYAIFTPLSTWAGQRLANLQWLGVRKVVDPEYIILIGTMLVNFATEYCVYRFWVYRKTINTSEAGKREQSQIREQEKVAVHDDSDSE
jgi:putative flippase GtrA